MKKILHIKYFILLLSIQLCAKMSAQTNQNPWSQISKQNAIQGKQLLKTIDLNDALYFQLDTEKLTEALNRVSKDEIHNVIISFPNFNGNFEDFRVKEASVLEPSFQLKYPEFRSYVGQNINEPSEIIRFSVTPNGLNSMKISASTGTQFIEPLSTDSSIYLVYNKQDNSSLKNNFECFFDERKIDSKEINTKARSFNANDGKLRTFRLALACTVEYSEFHWTAAGLSAADDPVDKRAKVLDAMVITMTRVNGIYERELSIRLEMIDNTNIIFIDTDRFTNDNAQVLVGESQTEIDGIIGESNYDIGHTFATGGGGFASPGVCVNLIKGRGATGSPSPVGDAFDIDFVAHEIGHQFGAPHTFNGDADNCSGGNRFASNAYEPGSGSTIMSYSGICAPQNVQNRSDDYFHHKSLQMIWDFITTGDGTCAVETATGNNAPTANAGLNYTIPISTPYKLIGSSTDADGTGTHTYTWEQHDLGPAGVPEETNITGPLVRSFKGTNNPVRNIPNVSDYLVSNGSTTWEKLPAVNRTMNFALTIRDNDINGGQTAVDFMDITVDSTDPFSVTNPVSWLQGSNQTIEWRVGQTANPSTINCQLVNIKLSTDGGLTYPIDLALNTPNDGSEVITVPMISNIASARLMVEAADNIFYDISDFDFLISTSPDFIMVNASLDPFGCGNTAATVHFDYEAVNGFSETATFSASGNPAGSTVSFSPENLNTSGSVTMTISNINLNNQGNFLITITATSSPSNIVKNINIDLPVFSNLCSSIGNIAYDTATTLVQFNTINKASSKPTPSGGYSDYTSISTEVNRNSNYDLRVNVNTSGNFTTATKVWIDWNQDCDFDDLGEEYDLGDATDTVNGPTANSPLTVKVPSDAALGNVIMRVSTKYKNDGLPTACEEGFDGEVEDYTIVIVPTLDVGEKEFEGFLVYPNPNKGVFTLKLAGSSESSINIAIFDISGRTIYNKNYPNRGAFNKELHLNNVQAGMYLLRVSDGLKTSTKKIIIK